ncbi:MAG: protein-ADP-ribose hydrolase [Fretibacterium sp.]|nr:protein-ADP-ribose hydrolase [Fretibacterium sp.]
MTRDEQIRHLIDALLNEMPEYKSQAAEVPPDERRRLLRALMNVRPPRPLSPEFLEVQDSLLSEEREARGVVDVMSLPHVPSDTRLYVWQGDITRLNADAMVNAANSALLGCFVPCHGCIDNAIHSAAGLQLRDECHKLMAEQGYEEPTGRAKITGAYNLPCRYVLHTVGPIVSGALQQHHCEELESCYRSCLAIAAEKGLRSMAFCCISTGEFHFPNKKAAEIAVNAVRDFLKSPSSIERVIFNVFKDIDLEIYSQLLGMNE